MTAEALGLNTPDVSKQALSGSTTRIPGAGPRSREKRKGWNFLDAGGYIRRDHRGGRDFKEKASLASEVVGPGLSLTSKATRGKNCSETKVWSLGRR